MLKRFWAPYSVAVRNATIFLVTLVPIRLKMKFYWSRSVIALNIIYHQAEGRCLLPTFLAVRTLHAFVCYPFTNMNLRPDHVFGSKGRGKPLNELDATSSIFYTVNGSTCKVCMCIVLVSWINCTKFVALPSSIWYTNYSDHPTGANIRTQRCPTVRAARPGYHIIILKLLLLHEGTSTFKYLGGKIILSGTTLLFRPAFRLNPRCTLLSLQ